MYTRPINYLHALSSSEDLCSTFERASVNNSLSKNNEGSMYWVRLLFLAAFLLRPEVLLTDGNVRRRALAPVGFEKACSGSD